MTVHRELAAGRWKTFDLVEQLGNIGSEVGRALQARRSEDATRAARAFERALELFDLTCEERGVPLPAHRLREVRRAREEFCRIFLEEEDESSAAGFERYFLAFAVLARRRVHEARVQAASSAPR